MKKDFTIEKISLIYVFAKESTTTHIIVCDFPTFCEFRTQQVYIYIQCKSTNIY